MFYESNFDSFYMLWRCRDIDSLSKVVFDSLSVGSFFKLKVDGLVYKITPYVVDGNRLCCAVKDCRQIFVPHGHFVLVLSSELDVFMVLDSKYVCKSYKHSES